MSVYVRVTVHVHSLKIVVGTPVVELGGVCWDDLVKRYSAIAPAPITRSALVVELLLMSKN
ncbi:hypothetical protein [Sulfolobus polyhedral virus 3]|nr:hypothetical protein [Sulfolobus polyhedral virus 3]